MLQTLDRAKAQRAGHLIEPLTRMAEFFKRRSIIVVISDLYEEPDALLDAMKPSSFSATI